MTKEHPPYIEVVNGEIIGRDPREMTKPELEQMGFKRMNLLRVIRENCIDCCGGQVGEVRKCTAGDCELWPYRMGKNTLREKKKLSDKQIKALKENFKK